MEKTLKTPDNQNPILYNLRRLENLKPSMRYDGTEDFSVWQKKAKEKLAELLGMDKLVRCPAELVIEHKAETEEYEEIRFTFQSEPGYRVPAVLRVPKSKKKGTAPLVVCLQGHSNGFHISLGKPVFDGDEAMISAGDRDFAVRIVKEGFAALAIEQRNFGECGGKETGGTYCHVSTMSALLQGRTTIGERVWDVSRALDAVTESFSDLVDTDEIMCMGNSGGGTATYYTACLEERIKLAMPSCAVATYKSSIGAMFHCVCNFVPHIAEYFDMGDLAGMIAPRSLVIVNGKKDCIFPDEGAHECFELAKELYAAAGAKDKCALVTGPEGHRFYADIGWAKAHELLGY